MKRILIGLLCAALSLNALAAGRLRLVLDSGWVVPLSADGRKLEGEAKRLELPAAAQGVYNFAVDHVQRKLYVTAQLPYAARGTSVFDLDSLKLLGFLPGVAEVVVPLDDEAPWLVTRTFLSADASAKGAGAVEQLRHLDVDAVTWELRRRKAWSEVASSRVKQPLSFASDMLPQCYSRTQKAFLDFAPYRSFDERLDERDADESAKTASLAQGRVVGCWANGDALLVKWAGEIASMNNWPASGALVRRSAGGKLTEVEPSAPRRLEPRDAALVPLGRDSRFALYAARESTFVLFDFEQRRTRNLVLSGNPSFAQYSRDHNAWYLPNVVYEFRGSSSLNYIEGMDGGATYADNVYRVSVDSDGMRVDNLEFPAELREIGEREAQLYGIDQLQESPEDYKQSLRDAVPPLGPLGQKLKTFAIVGVIAD